MNSVANEDSSPKMPKSQGSDFIHIKKQFESSNICLRHIDCIRAKVSY